MPALHVSRKYILNQEQSGFLLISQHCSFQLCNRKVKMNLFYLFFSEVGNPREFPVLLSLCCFGAMPWEQGWPCPVGHSGVLSLASL